jgi:tetratricopeptide (TPR) repeat protein
MASPAAASPPPKPNLAFRRLRGQLSPGEFAAAVRRAAREIGEQVACDARYIGRVEAGEIRCPNYAYERVFLHMFPGRTLADLGFSPRATVRGRRARGATCTPCLPGPAPGTVSAPAPAAAPTALPPPSTIPTIQSYEESDVLRRAFMTGGSATVAATLGLTAALGGDAARPPRRVGAAEASAVEEAVRRIRLLDDRYGADGLYQRAAQPLQAAYALLDASTQRRATADRLQVGAGELAITVGWLAHDSGRVEDARSHYAEALATARFCGDPALEAHAFCNMSFLARDSGRPREAVRTAQAAQQAAQQLSSPRLSALLALREAGGWAGLGDQSGCEQALARAQTLFERGPSDADSEWMSFFGEAELEGLEAQCWSALGEWDRAAEHARRAADLTDPHFTRNLALYTAELAGDLAHSGRPDEAAAASLRVLDLLDEVQSARIHSMLSTTARALLPHHRSPEVAAFLTRHGGTAPQA